MPRFLCLQRAVPVSSPSSGRQRPSQAEMEEMYARFDAWRQKFQHQIADMGGRLGAGRVVGLEATDGPFVEIKELVGGYMIVVADTAEEAAEVARGCPGLVGPGSGVEIIEILAP